jgi:hypothetical protein
VVARRFVDHAEQSKLFPVNTALSAVVSVMNEIIRSINDGKVVPLALLDLSVAFDTVDHDVLLEVLHKRFLVNDIP